VSGLGLLGLNALALGDGLAVLWALGAVERIGELVRLAGLGYLVGIAGLGVLATWLLVAGAPVSAPVVGGVAVGVFAAALIAGRAAGRSAPSLRRLPEASSEPLRVVGLGLAAAGCLYLADFFRAARLQTQFSYAEWDVWSSWTTKAKIFYFDGGLDPHAYLTTFLPGYPILVPALSAMAFSFMGSADTTTLHVQYWLLLAGFVFAIAGLLRPRVPHVLIWPFMLLLLATPQLNRLGIAPQADVVLDELVAGAGLCLALWLLERRVWLLPAAGILLAAAMSTKREGYLFPAAVVVGAAAGSAKDWRGAWPRLAATFLPAALATLPWVFWRQSNHVPNDLHGSNWGAFAHRFAPAAGSVARIVLWTDFWLVLVPLGIVAACGALVLAPGRRGPSVLFLVTLGLGYAGMVFALASGDYTLGALSDLNPIPRAAGAVALLAAAVTPLTLWLAWAPAPAAARAPDGGQRAATSAEAP
jgi:hypothetical protein